MKYNAKIQGNATGVPTTILTDIVDDVFSGCMQKADIAITMDISSSISLAEFEKRKQLLSDFVGRFPVKQDQVHFALISYNHFIHTEFTFDNPHFYSVDAVQKAILRVPLLGGATLTQTVLDRVLQVFSMAKYGARKSSTKILIIVTDGYTYGGVETLALPSLKLRVNIQVCLRCLSE